MRPESGARGVFCGLGVDLTHRANIWRRFRALLINTLTQGRKLSALGISLLPPRGKNRQDSQPIILSRASRPIAHSSVHSYAVWHQSTASTIVQANEVAPDPTTATDLGVRFAPALRFVDCRCTHRICIDPASRPDRYALHFGWSRVVGCGLFHL